MPEPEKLIPLHGGYRKLKSFQVAQLAYDLTVCFCDRCLEKRSRTHGQTPKLLSGEVRCPPLDHVPNPQS